MPNEILFLIMIGVGLLFIALSLMPNVPQNRDSVLLGLIGLTMVCFFGYCLYRPMFLWNLLI